MFEKWKQEHDEILKEKYRKRKEAESKVKQKEEEKEEERKRECKSAVSNWYESKKDMGFNMDIIFSVSDVENSKTPFIFVNVTYHTACNVNCIAITRMSQMKTLIYRIVLSSP